MRPGACVLLWAGVALGAGCAWGPGEPFATVSARIEARLEVPDGRDLGDGWQKLASNYEIAIEELSLETGGVALIDAGPGGQGFDPASPPPGYTLCHNGHCHAEDGALVPYEEVAAELGQGGALVAAVTLPVGDLDLAEGVERALDCAPSCDLPLASIVEARLDVRRIQARGRVRDGRDPARIDGEQAWTLDLSLDEPVSLSSPVDLPADRVHDPAVSLGVGLALTSRLFDDVAWAGLDAGPDGPDDYVLDADGGARAAMVEALGEEALAIDVAR